MREFKVGDKVIVDDGVMVGDVGHIIYTDNDLNEPNYLVSFPFSKEGTHDAGGRLPRHNGRWFYREDLTLIPKIDIEDDPEYEGLFI